MFLTHVETNRNANYWLGRQAFVCHEIQNGGFNGLYSRPIPSKHLVRCKTAPSLNNPIASTLHNWRDQNIVPDKINTSNYKIAESKGVDGIVHRVHGAMNVSAPKVAETINTFGSDLNHYRYEWYDSYKNNPPVVPKSRWAKHIHMDPSHWPNPGKDPRSIDRPQQQTISEAMKNIPNIRTHNPHPSTKRNDPFYCHREKNIFPRSGSEASPSTLANLSSISDQLPRPNKSLASAKIEEKQKIERQTKLNNYETQTTNTTAVTSASRSSFGTTITPSATANKWNYTTTTERNFNLVSSGLQPPESYHDLILKKKLTKCYPSEEQSLRILPSMHPGGGIKYPTY